MLSSTWKNSERTRGELGGGRLVDCSHTLDPTTFSFISSFLGSNNTYFDLEDSITEFSQDNKQQQQQDIINPSSSSSSCSSSVRKVAMAIGRFRKDTINDSRSRGGYYKCLYRMACDVGTHIDSPSHWYENARDVSQLTLSELCCPGVVIDCRDQVQSNPDYALTVDDILQWEKRHQQTIPPGALVCMRTGWSSKFRDVESYMGIQYDVGDDGAKKPKCHFPGFSSEAAKLVIERDVAGIGIDTPSLDIGISLDYPVHCLILGSDRYQIENMVLDNLPESNLTFISLPLKVAGGPESETRVIAIVRE